MYTYIANRPLTWAGPGPCKWPVSYIYVCIFYTNLHHSMLIHINPNFGLKNSPAQKTPPWVSGSSFPTENEQGGWVAQKPHNKRPHPSKKGLRGSFEHIKNKCCVKTDDFLIQVCLKSNRFGPSWPNPLFWPCHGIKDPTLRAGDIQKEFLDKIKGAEGYGLGLREGFFYPSGPFSMVGFFNPRVGFFIAWRCAPGWGFLIRSSGYLSPQNPLHVGRRSRPTCTRFFWCVYRYFPGGPK